MGSDEGAPIFAKCHYIPAGVLKILKMVAVVLIAYVDGQRFEYLDADAGFLFIGGLSGWKGQAASFCGETVSLRNA